MNDVGYKASYYKLKDDSFGARVVGLDVSAGETIRITTKAGEVQKRKVKAVLASFEGDREGEEGQSVILCSLEKDEKPKDFPNKTPQGRNPRPPSRVPQDDDIPF